MKNNVTEVVFILDRSGSMCGSEADTVGGFNAALAQQKQKGGRVYVSTVLFNDHSEVLHDRIPIDEIPEMTRSDYLPAGGTALCDAVGNAIRHIRNIHKYVRPEDVPAHTVFLITTDGMENASRTFNRDSVRREIEKMKKEYGWEFIFLAADIDADGFAREIGIEPENAVEYDKDCGGIQASFMAMNDAISAVREERPLAASGWKKRLEKKEKM